MFAHDNAIENLVIFAPLVLITDVLNVRNGITAFACALYFWSRLAHLVIYTAGWPVGRTLAFTGGFVAQMLLLIEIFAVGVRSALGKQRDLLEAHGLGIAEHQVHVLHRLPGRALHQVVERRDDDGAARHAVLGDADEGHVRAADVPGLRRLAERQDVDERLLRVEL